MDCRKMEELLSPYLDGELSPAEAEAVRSHLSSCACCDQEYMTMLRISAACHDMSKVKLAAPAGFKDALMQRINEEQRTVVTRRYSNWLQPRWKQAAAGIAAAVMLAVGTISMNTAPIIQIAEKWPAIYQPGNDIPVAIDPVNNGTVTSASNHNTNGTQNDPANPSVALVPAVNGTPTANVFLNRERYLSTTLLQIKVADSAAALEQALKLSAEVQAQTIILGQQFSEEGSYTAVKITVPKSLAQALLNRLSLLGTVTAREVDKKEITSSYADTLSQYQNLVTQRATLQDDAQKADLDQRIGSLAAELQDWEQQAELETIVLRLE